MLVHKSKNSTGELRRLGRSSLDWATVVIGEADRELTWVNFTYHSSGPIYETSAQSMELSGTFWLHFHIFIQTIFLAFQIEVFLW